MKSRHYTYVQNVDGKPLMPTTRGGRVRYLLKSGAARVVKHVPFTIRLNYATEDQVQELVLGIDPGRTNIGLSVVDGRGECVLSAEVETRNKDIPKLMSERKVHRQARRHYGRRSRRQRRARAKGTVNRNGSIQRVLPQTGKPIECKFIINKEARFCNRKREQGWLTPTANQLLQTHLNLIEKLRKILPIQGIAVEVNKFSFMELDNRSIRPWEYQRGPLHGFDSRDDAVYALQNGKCLLCGKPRVDHYHHVVPRHDGGSNTIRNIVGLCSACHDSVHTSDAAMEQLREKHAGAVKQYAGTSVLNQIIPQFVERMIARGEELYMVTGTETAEYRRVHELDKEHNIDAYCIAMLGSNVDPCVNYELRHPYLVKQFRRHDRQVCHQQMVDRKYYLNGKLVAKNRHKRFEQNGDSLVEFLERSHGVQPEMLTVPEHPPVYKRRDRITPGALMRCGSDVFVYSTGTPIIKGVPFYAVDTNGVRRRYASSRLIVSNQGLVFAKQKAM